MNNEMGLNIGGEGGKIALKGISWLGTVDGLIFTCVTTQEYVNTDTKTLEISYTFPLSWDAAVTEFAAEIGGKRLVATPLPKKEAEDKYEKAMQEGDLPLLLQCSDEFLGLYTANLGNVKPGERIKIEIHTAQVLLWNQGEVRLNLPTVIPERYSSNGAQGKLLPHEQVRSSLFADYYGNAKIEVKGQLAKASITSLNHVASFLNQEDGTVIEIKNAKPDKDIAFLFTNVEAIPSAIRVVPLNQPGNAVEVCTFYPLGTKNETPLNLNILVDCSGSMDGIPINQARQALLNLFKNLKETDRITFTRFGSSFTHDINRGLPVTETNLRRDIEPLVAKMDADLGGTEMAAALSSVFSISDKNSDILLITDGDIWGAEQVVEQAFKGGHRIFVIGVSSSPAEPLLRQLAEKTKGACSVVMPAEDMKSVLINMVDKMRTQKFSYELIRGTQKEEVDLWASQSATFIWNESRPSALPELKCLIDPSEKILSPNRWIPNSSSELYSALLKIYALNLYRSSKDEEEQEDISKKFGLLSPYVSYVMVHERAESEKFKGFPESQITPQMFQGEILSSPQVLDLGPEEDWKCMGLESSSITNVHASSLGSYDILGASQPQKKISSSMLKNSKTTRKPATSRSRSKKKPSPFTEAQENWIRQTLKMADVYLELYGSVNFLSMLVDECQSYLLSTYADRFTEQCQIALVILLFDAYFQKYIRKNNEADLLRPETIEKLLNYVPYKEVYIRRSCEKLMPEYVLMPFLIYQESELEKDINDDDDDDSDFDSDSDLE